MRYLVSTVVIALAVFLLVDTRTPDPQDPFINGHIKSAIMLNTSIDKNKRAALYNTRLLQALGDDHHSTTEVYNAYGKFDYWDSLSQGNIDIIVTDSIPEGYEGTTIRSVPVQGEYWVTDSRNTRLLNSANMWLNYFLASRDNKLLVAKYLTSYSIYPQAKEYIGNGERISPYDAIVKKYGKYIGWDWRLLSSVVYQESRFMMGVEYKNAVGLMQVKQSTADFYGVEDVYDPELNIRAGALHLQRLAKMFGEQGLDSINVIKFSLAAYNAGEGRIEDCMNIAAERGLDPNNWDDVVNVFQYMSNFSGEITKRYVQDILDRYQRYCIIAE